MAPKYSKSFFFDKFHLIKLHLDNEKLHTNINSLFFILIFQSTEFNKVTETPKSKNSSKHNYFPNNIISKYSSNILCGYSLKNCSKNCSNSISKERIKFNVYLSFIIQLVISSFFWNRYIEIYADLFEDNQLNEQEKVIWKTVSYNIVIFKKDEPLFEHYSGLTGRVCFLQIHFLILKGRIDLWVLVFNHFLTLVVYHIIYLNQR